MQRYTSLVTLLGAPALVALTMLSGCAGGEEKKPDAGQGASKPRVKIKGGGALAELEAPTDGVVKGRVVLDGDAPKIALITMMAEHADKKVCLAGSDVEKSEQYWVLAPDKKGVANVVIKLLPPEGKKFKNIAPEKKEVEIDQPHCAFVPHVVAVTPGQLLVVKNSAPVPHNTKMQADSNAGNENRSETIQPGKSVTITLNPQRAPIKIGCDFHNWMTGFVYVNDSPYIAVTDANGDFEIKNVPTGVALSVVGIHESGNVEGGKQGTTKTFSKGDNQLDLKVKAP
jgi:plastocyanin